MPSARPLQWDSAFALKELTGYGGGEHRTGTIFHRKHSESTIQARQKGIYARTGTQKKLSEELLGCFER